MRFFVVPAIVAAAAIGAALPAAAAPDAYRDAISRHAASNNVPFALANAVVRVESRYNPNARNRANLGLTQISHATARGLGYSGGAAGLFNPETNLTWGIKYLGIAYKMAGGNVCGTIMRYQGGLRATRMTGANRAYCAKVQALMRG